MASNQLRDANGMLILMLRLHYQSPLGVDLVAGTGDGTTKTLGKLLRP